MRAPIYRPIADGVYQNEGSIISVGSGQCLSVSEKKRNMRVWVGELPDGWKLCELVDAGNAFGVPVEDIERILRGYDLTYGNVLDNNLRARRVQRWLDSLPKKEDSE